MGSILSERIRGEAPFRVVSNEGALFRVLKHIRNVRGVGLGVGFDQMLEFVVHSNLSKAYILDITPRVSLSTKALLEVGRQHRTKYGRSPTPEEYLEYFSERSISSTLSMIKENFTDWEFGIVEAGLKSRVEKDGEKGTSASGPLEVYSYLRYKISQSNYPTWISTSENIKKVLRMYESGDITVVLGDLAGTSAMQKITALVEGAGEQFGLVYLSNAPQFIDRAGGTEMDVGMPEQFQKNLERLPKHNDTLFLSANNLGSRTAPLPEEILKDPYLRKFNTSWSFYLQSQSDRSKERAGGFTAELDGRVYVLDRSDRLHLFEKGADAPGIKEPSKGVYLFGFSE